jgi:signal peptidase I
MHAAILNPDTVYHNDNIFIPKYSSKINQPRLLALVKIHDIASKYTIPIKIGDTILIEISDVYNVDYITGYVAMWEPGQEIKQKQYWSRGPSSAHFDQKQIELNRYYSALMDVEVNSDVSQKELCDVCSTEEKIVNHTFRVVQCRGFNYFEKNTLFKINHCSSC